MKDFLNCLFKLFSYYCNFLKSYAIKQRQDDDSRNVAKNTSFSNFANMTHKMKTKNETTKVSPNLAKEKCACMCFMVALVISPKIVLLCQQYFLLLQ